MLKASNNAYTTLSDEVTCASILASTAVWGRQEASHDHLMISYIVLPDDQLVH